MMPSRTFHGKEHERVLSDICNAVFQRIIAVVVWLLLCFQKKKKKKVKRS